MPTTSPLVLLPKVSTLARSDPMTTLVELLFAGNDVDYDLRVPGYVFKVHRKVLFAALDTASTVFRYADSAIITATNDHMMVLRLIQAIYTNEYVENPDDLTPEWAGYLKKSQIFLDNDEGTILETTVGEYDDDYSSQDETMVDSSDTPSNSSSDAASSTTSWSDFYWEYSPQALLIHSAMFSLSQRYALPHLTTLSFKYFIIATSNSNFTVDQLLWTLESLYTTAPPFPMTHKPRMRLVYLAQRLESALHQAPYLAKFTALVQGNSALAMDLLTRCMRDQYWQCPSCEATFKPDTAQGECDCGGEGVCTPCVEFGGEDGVWRKGMCHGCSGEMLKRWDLEMVEIVDISSVKALEGVFHPSEVA